MGEKFLVDLSRDTRGVRLAAVSTRIDEPDCSPFVFRSYGLPCGTVSHYEGSSKFKIWEAMRASTAAPGFFQDFRLDNIIHQVRDHRHSHRFLSAIYLDYGFPLFCIKCCSSERG